VKEPIDTKLLVLSGCHLEKFQRHPNSWLECLQTRDNQSRKETPALLLIKTSKSGGRLTAMIAPGYRPITLTETMTLAMERVKGIEPSS